MKRPVTPLGPVGKTPRSFECIVFKDRYNTRCSLQQSSIFDDDCANHPGASAVWLGVDKVESDEMLNTRMHLDRPRVRALVAVLEQWLANGSFIDAESTSAADSPRDPKEGQK